MKKLYLLITALLITTGNVSAMQKRVNFAPDTKEETNKPFSTAQEYTDAYIACLDGMDALNNNQLTRNSEQQIDALYTRYATLKNAWASSSKPSNLEIKRTDMATMPTRMGDTARTLNQKYNTAILGALKTVDIETTYDYLFSWTKLLRTHLNYDDAPTYLKPIEQYHKAVTTFCAQNQNTVQITPGNITALNIELSNLRAAFENKNNNNK